MSDAKRLHSVGGARGRIHELTASRAAELWLLGLLALVVVLLLPFAETARLALRYERSAILAGHEYWRLLTAHVVHGSVFHAMMNLAGLGLIAALFPRHYSVRAWLVIAFASVLAIDIGFLWLEPDLAWYVGLSGVLHGALAAGALAWWRFESKVLAAALTLIFIGKLLWEQWAGALPLSGDLPVIVDAHLYGAIGGVLAAFGIHASRQGWFRIVRPL